MYEDKVSSNQTYVKFEENRNIVLLSWSHLSTDGDANCKSHARQFLQNITSPFTTGTPLPRFMYQALLKTVTIPQYSSLHIFARNPHCSTLIHRSTNFISPTPSLYLLHVRLFQISCFVVNCTSCLFILICSHPVVCNGSKSVGGATEGSNRQIPRSS